MTVDPRAVMMFALLVFKAPGAAWGGDASDRTASRFRASAVSKPRRALLESEALDRLRGLLASDDPATVLTAVKALGDSGAPNAALPLVEMLGVGAQPPATVAALDALKRLRDVSSIEILVLYAGNRGTEIRRHAVEALGTFADGRVVPILMDRLGDGAPEVRAAAAQALATRGEKAAVPRLLALLKRNDATIVGPLGALAPLSTLPEIAGLQGSISDDNLASVLGELLQRQDVSESARLDLVKTLARVPGAASTTALIEYVGTATGRERRPSKSEAQKVIDERGKGE